MKKILVAALLMTTTQSSIGQSADTYIFKVENGKAYTPLTTGTNITAGLLWDEENFKIPMGFTAEIGDKTISYFSILPAIFAPASDTENVVHAFSPYGADLADRSISGTPQSPIRYVVTGTTPNRIFKLEFFNAGFFNEYDLYMTNEDSVNLQVWVYETSNIVEFRYGPSKVTYPMDYFDREAPMIGYVTNLDLLMYSFDKVYTLKGAPMNPELDSTNSGISMTAPPAEGTVYRFVPKKVATSIGEVDITGNFKIYPTVVTESLIVEYNRSEPATARVMNQSGQLINVPVSLSNGKNLLDVGGLPAGQFLMQVATTEGNAVYKFVKR